MVFVKALGIALVIAGFGTWHLLVPKRIEKRVEQIEESKIGFVVSEKEITYNYTPFTRAMERTYRFSPKPVNYIFRDCSSLNEG